ncbi:MAG: hypothetical protein HYR60_12540 [Acidobacteria bacterium]|nr:hypothetical protein [Acidobacteriota bacterium]
MDIPQSQFARDLGEMGSLLNQSIGQQLTLTQHVDLVTREFGEIVLKIAEGQRQLTGHIERLTVSRRDTGERMDALIRITDEWIRRPTQ